MDYKGQIQYLRFLEHQSQHIEASAFASAARSITDLLDRAEAAEIRAKKAERELDAAIERIKEDHWCEDCKFRHVAEACRSDSWCFACNAPCFCKDCDSGSKWEWRGKKGDST